MEWSKISLVKITGWIFIISMVVSSCIKIASVYGNNFAFTIDQGRDMIDVRHMVEMGSPRLVGPTTSINGVLLGPSYYYFISIPYLLGGGHPAAIVYWQIFTFQISVVILWAVIKSKNKVLANVVGSILLLSPIGFYTARYFWNANAMPTFTILFVASLINTLWNKDKISFLTLGLVSGISLQIEAAFGIIFIPFVILIFTLNRQKLYNFFLALVSFFITLLPQIVFELRHGFIMSKTLLAGLTGKSEVLGEKLDLAQRVSQRTSVYLASVREASHIPYEYLIWIFFAGLVYYFCCPFYKKVSPVVASIFNTVFCFYIFSYGFYLLFPQNLKSWYTLGLPIFSCLILAGIIYLTLEGKLSKYLGLLILIASFAHVYLAHSEYLQKISRSPSDDPSNLVNQIKVMDYIYNDASGKNFKVYIYLPSIYDYTYQYLFWWYGVKNFSYMPSDLAYLPNQPEYIEDMKLFHKPNKNSTPEDSTYLIIEKGDNVTHFQEWWGNFANQCKTEELLVVPNLRLIKLNTCDEEK